MDNNEIKETKQTIKESVDLAKNVKSGNIIGAAKNAMNLLKSEKIKKKIRLKIILAALKLLLPIMVIVILASSVLSIFTAVTDKMDELKSNITTFTTSVWKWFTNDYWIDIEKEIDCVIDEETGETEKQTLIDQYMSETEKMGISIQKLKLLGDADYTSEEVMNDPKNIALMKKYLKEFIRADLISQEIHRRRGNGPLVNPLNEDEIDGGIYLYRSENELTSGNLQKYRMEYVTQSDFESKIESKPNDLEKYFTIDQTTGELLYPQIDTVKIEKKKGKTWSLESIEKTVTVKKCDYKSIIAKYSLPYEFLTDLCMISQNPEFVYRVALMARTTNISLVILDNETETIDTVEEEITTTTLTNLDSASSEGATSSEKTDEIGTRTTTVQTNPQIVIEEVVDSWIYKGKKTYTNNANKTKVGPSEKNGSVDSKPSVLTDTGKTQSVPVATNNTVGTEFTTYRDAKVYSASYISNHKIITTNEVNTNNFDDGVVENEIIKSDDFLGLLRNKDGETISVYDFKNGKRIKFLEEGKNVAYPIPNSEETIQEMPLNKIISGAEILFHQLRRNSKTVGLEEVMRYLLQFPTGNDYGVTLEEILYIYKMENPSNGSVADGSIIVKTDEPGAAPAVTKEQLIQIINAYFKGQQKTNALSLVDTLIQGQDQYKVNAVFELAILQKETSVGTAKTNYVNRDKNWTSYNLGHKYATPQESVIASMKAIATGSHYFTQGKYTIKEIGYTYCPNEASHPTQGDDWVACVSSYVVSMYNSIGVQVSTSSSNGSGSISIGTGGGTKYTSSFGKTYTEYKQFDSAWASNSFAGGTMKNSGCSLSAVAVILTGYGKNVSPESLRQSVNGQMTNLCNLLSNNGVSSTRISHKLSNSEIISQLKTGKPIIVLVGKPWASGSGHYMCLLDYKSSGGKDLVYVSNPGKNASHYNGWYDVNEIAPYTLASAGSIFITQ